MKLQEFPGSNIVVLLTMTMASLFLRIFVRVISLFSIKKVPPCVFFSLFTEISPLGPIVKKPIFSNKIITNFLCCRTTVLEISKLINLSDGKIRENKLNSKFLNFSISGILCLQDSQ